MSADLCSNEMSLQVGRMAALAEAAQREFEGDPVTDHGIWLLDLLNADLHYLKSRIDNGDHDCERPQAELGLIGGAS